MFLRLLVRLVFFICFLKNVLCATDRIDVNNCRSSGVFAEDFDAFDAADVFLCC